MFVVEYHIAEHSSGNDQLLEKIDIRIGNTWEGKTPVLKNEIDIIADQVVSRLEKRFGSANMSVKREFKTPM